MDGELPVLSEQNDDHLEHVACPVGSDHEDLRTIGVRVEVHHGDCMFNCVPDVFVTDAVPSSRPVDVDTRLV